MFWDTACDNVAINYFQRHDDHDLINNAASLHALPLKICNVGLQLTHWSSWKACLTSSLDICTSPTFSTQFPVLTAPTPTPKSSPISALPVEILGQIFEHFLQTGEDTDDSENGFFSVNSEWNASPLILGQICGHWRDVVVSMPTLWSSISIAAPKKNDLLMANLWLQRAGCVPLSISITQQVCPCPEEVAVTDDLIRLFATRMDSWRRIAFHFEGDGMQRSLLQLPQTHFPQLRALSLQMDTWSDPDAFEARDAIWRMFASAPVLNEVSLDDCIEIPSCIPWAQLEHLNITCDLSIAEFFGLLQAAPRLQTLTVWRIVSTEGAGFCPNLIMPYLRSLSLTSTVELKAVFDVLNAPSLTQLSLNLQPFPGMPQRPIALNDFLDRSECPLQSFSLRHATIGEDELAQMLSCPRLANVTSLDLQAPISEKSVHFFASSPSSSDVPPFPRLQSLSVLGCQTSIAPVAKLLDARSASQLAVPSLSTLKVGFSRRLSKAELLELEGLREVSKVAIEFTGSA